MTQDHKRVEELYQRALDLAPEARDEFLRRECEGQSALERSVRRLLEHFESAPAGFLRGPTTPWSTRADTESIGPYELDEVVGEGGMGVVYRARQSSPVRRTVALKILRLGLDTTEIVRRFEGEGQALALLSHPGIAQVYDAGTTPDGRPFFVMEFVDGVPITEYCDERRLAPRQRIELLVEVCRAVQHAHQKGIIHRDLKPSNILVSEHDGRPVPKVIDFGIAKATQQRLTEQTMYTQLGQLIGTPEYISPEQAQGFDVDTRSDVYSLGVVLYELLVGALPLDKGELREAGFEGMMRMIREKDPQKPSTRVSTLGNTATDASSRRGTEPRSLARTLRGDLDWIVMTSLAKERDRRYATVQEFAADLQRHLKSEPVSARPASLGYQLTKIAGRHRMAVGISMVVVGFTLVMAVVMTVQAERVARERDRASVEAATAQSVSDFLVGLFQVTDPDRAPADDASMLALLEAERSTAGSITAREMLAAGVKRAQSLDDQPLIQARFLGTIGSVYINHGLHAEAESLLADAHELYRQELGELDPETLKTGTELARVFWQQGRFDEAEQAGEKIIEAQKRALGVTHRQTLTAMNNLSLVYRDQGRFAEAESLIAFVAREKERTSGPDDMETLYARSLLANYAHDQGRLDEAEAIYRSTLDTQHRVLGERHPATLRGMNNLAALLLDRSQPDAAEPLLRRALDLSRDVWGENHFETLNTVTNLAAVYVQRGDHQRALPLYESIEKHYRRALGDEHLTTLGAVKNTAVVLRELGRYDEAEPRMLHVLDTRKRDLGARHPDTARAYSSLGILYQRQGDLQRAIPMLEAALDIRREVLGADHPTTQRTLRIVTDARNEAQR